VQIVSAEGSRKRTEVFDSVNCACFRFHGQLLADSTCLRHRSPRLPLLASFKACNTPTVLSALTSRLNCAVNILLSGFNLFLHLDPQPKEPSPAAA